MDFFICMQMKKKFTTSLNHTCIKVLKYKESQRDDIIVMIKFYEEKV